MRVYLPATLPLLRRWYDDGRAPVARGFAVTAALRESYRDGDLEELEWVAQQAAARASLELLAADEEAPRRRVVLAMDVPDAALRADPGLVAGTAATDPASVTVTGEVARSQWASVLVDDPAASFPATPDGAAIAGAIDVARRGGGGRSDPEGQDRLDDAEAVELGWWAIQELPALFG